MNKKATTMIVYGLIIGFMLFTITAFAFGHGIMSAFNSFKVSKQSMTNLMETIQEVANETNNIDLKLVPSQFDEDMAIYMFNNGTVGLSEYYCTEDDPEWDGSGYSLNSNCVMYRRVIEKPMDCDQLDGLCVCLCAGFKLEELKLEGETKLKFNKYYPAQGELFSLLAYRLNCQQSLECFGLKNVTIQDFTDLKKIVSDNNYKKIEDASDKYVFEWEDGMSLWRYEEEPYNLLVPNKLADLYVVRNSDYTIGICFDPDCILHK